MAVDYNVLLQTLQSENMDGETTYTRNEAYKMAQVWRNEEQRTSIKAADEQMHAARVAYFQAIEAYKQAYGESHSKLRELEKAINRCYYETDSFLQRSPVSLGSLSPNQSLMQVTHNEMVNSELHVKGTV